MTLDAGICWLNRVAGLNPATSHVIREWDRVGVADYAARAELLAILKEARARRTIPAAQDNGPNRVAELVEC